MNIDKENGVPAGDASGPASEAISRRDFVERLRRAAMFVAPVVATVALTTPEAKGTPPY